MRRRGKGNCDQKMLYEKNFHFKKWKNYCFTHPEKQASYSAWKEHTKMDSLLKGNSLSDLLTKKGRKGKEKCIHQVLFGDI